MTIRDTSEDTPGSLIGGSAEEFGELADRHRRELLVHCYRMLGSIDDAEDAVQEAFVRAWRGRTTFKRAISVRAWLYRIATNVCLDAIARRTRANGHGAGLSVGPIPDDVLDEVSAEPEALYDAHESISLAFLTALQLLPPRQRAVLILRDVLAWRAAEVAELLELSVPAVNSALHRARATTARQYRSPFVAAHQRQKVESTGLRALLERYVRAWETADVAALVALLRDDAVVSMPPGLILRGTSEIRAFLAASVFADGMQVRLRPIQANRAPGFAIYSGAAHDDALGAYAVMLLEVDDSRITRLNVFADRRLIARFGLPAELPG